MQGLFTASCIDGKKSIDFQVSFISWFTLVDVSSCLVLMLQRGNGVAERGYRNDGVGEGGYDNSFNSSDELIKRNRG